MLSETNFRYKLTKKLKVRGLKKIFDADSNQKRAGVSVLLSETDFK